MSSHKQKHKPDKAFDTKQTPIHSPTYSAKTPATSSTFAIRKRSVDRAFQMSLESAKLCRGGNRHGWQCEG